MIQMMIKTKRNGKVSLINSNLNFRILWYDLDYDIVYTEVLLFACKSIV